MDGAPTLLDLGIMIALCALMPALEARWWYPRFCGAVTAGRSGARPRYYALTIAVLWAFVGAVVVVWAVYRRPWALLYLRPARPRGAWLGLGLSVLYVSVVWWQIRALLAEPDGRARLRRALAGAAALLPRTSGERWGFALVSVTAGICEEVLFRGFVMWYCALWTGPIGAVVLSAVLFGIGHVYQGVRQVPRTALAGLVLAGVVLAAGALWPAMLLHAVMDLVAGQIGYVGLSEQNAIAPE
jgi:uncharacterized protein